MAKKVVKQLTQAQRLAQELINREIKLPKEVSKVSVVYHNVSTSNKPYRNLVKYRFETLSAANPHITFQKTVKRTESNNNFVTVEMADGTQQRITFRRRDFDTDKVANELLVQSQKIVPSVDVQLAKYLQTYEERIAASRLVKEQ